MTEPFSHSFACMGTVVTLQTLQPTAPTPNLVAHRNQAFSNARAWFRRVEHTCNRFDATSELRRLCAQPGRPVTVSDVLFEALQFAVAVANATGGVFDPTVGRTMHERGFDRDYRTGEPVAHPDGALTSGALTRGTLPDVEMEDAPNTIKSEAGTKRGAPATYDDIELDTDARTVTLHAPLVLDLGAVAKGLAVDMAVRELADLPDIVVDAGGDLFVRGCNPEGEPWRIGIRHPRNTTLCVETIFVAEGAICTSGDYERHGRENVSHILHAISGRPADSLASVTVIAPSAMVADALGTAAFALGPDGGLTFLRHHGVDALLMSPSLQRWQTPGWASHISADAIRADIHPNLISR